MKMFLKQFHESGALYVFLFMLLVLSAICYCEYQLTKKALTEVMGKSPTPCFVIYSMIHDARNIKQGGK